VTDVPLTLAADVVDRVRVGWVRAEPVRVAPACVDLEAACERAAVEFRDRYAGRPPAGIEPLQAARILYKAFGIDPTKTRPSSEALLRRALRELPLPRILNAVDVGNLLSLSFLLPIGLYDVDRIEGEVTLRAGRADEAYAGIRKKEVHLEGRPVLADLRGPFGNPTSDSSRTSVDTATRSLWMVIFAPAGYPRERLEAHVALSRATISRHLAPADRPAHTAGAVVR